MFPWGLLKQICSHQVSEGASDAYTLTCEYRDSFTFALTSNWEDMGLTIVDRFCDIGVTCSPLPPPNCLDRVLNHCSRHFTRHQTNPAACEQVITPLILHFPPDALRRCGNSGICIICQHTLLKLALAPDKTSVVAWLP